MSGVAFRKKTKLLFFLIVVIAVFCPAGELNTKNLPLDKTRHITIDEIKPGMKAYCLTIYKDTNIEKFNLEVLSVIRNIAPGKNAILVQGTDERFIHTGPVAGCSGSPVYIEGRLAGALAFGWAFSKDALYGVTPIEEMLRVGQIQSTKQEGLTIDFSRPIDFTMINRELTRYTVAKNNTILGATALPCPLITSGVSSQACEQLETFAEPLGLMVVAGSGIEADTSHDENVQLAPGACLAVPVVTGDIKMEIIGTVTDVVGDRVYGFGHNFLGYGPVDLPMATGRVHAVISNIYSSFKVGSSIRIVGALTNDESTGVCGRIGLQPSMIPMTITIDHYNDTKKRTYNCRLVNNQILTGQIAGLGARRETGSSS